MRWIARILITLVVLLLIAAAGIQAVLWSDWPRREVITRLQQETGLVIEAGSMRPGWFGRTVLKDVSVRLPLADQPFVQMPELRVEHTALLPMMLRRRVDIESLRSDGAQIHLMEDGAGQWNVQHVAELIAARRAIKTKDTVITPLPLIAIRNAQVNITNTKGETISLPTAQFAGQPDGLLEWTCESDALPLVKARGRLAMGEGTPHELHLQIAEAQHLLAVIAHQQIADSINADMIWNGKVHGGSLQGRARVNAASIGEHSITGVGEVALTDGKLTVSQPHLTISSAAMDGTPLVLSGGAATWHDGALELEQSHVHALGAAASLHAHLDMRARTGRIESHWSGQRQELQLAHRGSIIADVQWPEIGTKRISASLHTAGTLPEAQWESELRASAVGESWRDMTGRIEWSKLTGQFAARQVDLSALAAAVTVAWPNMRIDSLSLPNAQADGVAAFNAELRAWSVEMALKKWTLPITGDMMKIEPLDLNVNAKGTPQRIDIEALDIQSGAYELNASGTFIPGDGQPLAAQALAKMAITAPSPADAGAVQPAPQQNAGGLEAHLQLRGRLQPLTVNFSGQVTGQHLPIGKGTIDHLAAPMQGTVTSERVVFQSDGAALLDGSFDVRGEYSPGHDSINMHVTARDASILKLARIAGAARSLEGRAGGAARLHFFTHDPTNLTIEDGHWRAENVRTPAGVIAHAAGTLRGSNGIYQVSDVSITSDASAEPGVMTGSAIFNATSKTLAIDGDIAHWPWRETSTSAALRVSGPAKLQIDLASGHLAGSAALKSAINVRGERIGEVRAEITAEQRTLRLSRIEANLWNASITGNASIMLDQLTNSRGELHWQNMELSNFIAFLPQLDLLTGATSGTATIQPTDDERALGPMRFHIALQMHEVRSRSVEIGDMTVSGYAGPNLLIADDATMKIADGRVQVWGRMSRHGSDPFAHVTATFDRLDLNQLVHWVDPDEGIVPGRLSGGASAGGYLRPVGGSHRLFGQSDLTLVESDLVNITIFTLIHDALSLSIGDVQPHGEGRASIRLEGNALELSRMEYYNRGTDVVASVRIEDVRLRGQSPISGVAVGAMRPLKKLSVPFFADFDRAIKALQTGAASVRISGTVETPEQKLVPFAEIAGAFERILTGSAN
jgi:hypothetical protein